MLRQIDVQLGAKVLTHEEYGPVKGKIIELDRHTFTVKWKDGFMSYYSMDELPCNTLSLR